MISFPIKIQVRQFELELVQQNNKKNTHNYHAVDEEDMMGWENVNEIIRERGFYTNIFQKF